MTSLRTSPSPNKYQVEILHSGRRSCAVAVQIHTKNKEINILIRVFWDVKMLCCKVDPEDGGRKLLWNVGNYLQQ
jgi:hypothetical protein